MILVKVKGGLGNQLFQLALAINLVNMGFKVHLDISSYKTYKLHGGYQLHNFNHSIPTLENSFLVRAFKMIAKNLNYEKLIYRDLSNIFTESKNLYIDGYFQNEKYFLNSRQLILECFDISKSYLNKEYLDIQNDILSKNRCSVHVRRGDYTTEINSKIHGLLDIEYYQKAIDFMRKNGINNFLVFSDDIEWCKNNLNFIKSDILFSDFGFNQIQDLMLMSKCNSNIIANSSFSWWGAWLNRSPKKIIIAPKKWLSSDPNVDVIPNNWIKI